MRTRDRSDTVQLSKIRMKEALRARLEADAEARRVTLNAVIVDRLESSFRGDEAFGGRRTAELLRFLGSLVTLEGYDDGWLSDRRQFNEVMDRWQRHFVELRQKIEPADRVAQETELKELSEMFDRFPQDRRNGLRQLAKRLSDIANLDPDIRASYAVLSQEVE